MKVTIPDTVLSTELQNEAVLLNLETGEYFGLNEVGMAFWKLLSGGTSVAAARAALLADYDVAEDELKRDLDALLAALAQRQLLKIDPA